MNQKIYTIPAELVSQFETWGKMTTELFAAIRHHADVKPADTIDDQAWFWTEEWQALEREADEDIEAGRVMKFDNVDDLIKELHSHV